MRLKIEVGEPRGFRAADGTNVITGTLIEELSGSHVIDKDPTIATMIQTPKGEQAAPETITEYWFVAECAPPVDFQGMRFKSLLITPRYKVKKPPVETLQAGDALVINAIWRQDGEAWDRGSIEAAQEGRIEVEGMIVAKVTRLD